MRRDLEKDFEFKRIVGKTGAIIGPAGDDSGLTSSAKTRKVT